MNLPRRAALAHSIAASLLFCVANAGAQEFPSQPIRIVVPYAAGGMTDIVARVIGQKLGEHLGQPVVIDNRPGAATIVGAEVVAGAKPDGYTLLAATNTTLTINPWLYPKLRYDAGKSFTPIALVASAPSVIVVNPLVPAKTLSELMQLAKARHGGLSYASYGNGSTAHLAGEMLAARAGAELLHVPYKGSAPAKAAVIAGEVNMTFEPAFTGLPQISSGKLRALAVMSSKRSAVLPDVPTTAELGYPGMEMAAWVGLMAPAGTPTPIVKKLASEVEHALTDPAVLETLLKNGAEPAGYYGGAFAAYLRDETARYGKVIADARIHAD
ncbi:MULTISPECIES: Bug family tripartite tricarboxylate transporter substrate binding protein [Cupriavidus]|uniref:Bug family tripartite tricarboxylate transporter substrate binding protein n=1 Tax=Cupriavidus TaxID=106589 RepID=UPI0002A25A4B|nr:MULTISPECIES: tripartite tricarboxylate transporter substrate binding protein [Cupriavidus]EKZ96043.1 ABC transporter substrate-binding protein [Cupriavidus sp. HMR-1]